MIYYQRGTRLKGMFLKALKNTFACNKSHKKLCKLTRNVQTIIYLSNSTITLTFVTKLKEPDLVIEIVRSCLTAFSDNK